MYLTAVLFVRKTIIQTGCPRSRMVIPNQLRKSELFGFIRYESYCMKYTNQISKNASCLLNQHLSAESISKTQVYSNVLFARFTLEETKLHLIWRKNFTFVVVTSFLLSQLLKLPKLENCLRLSKILRSETIIAHWGDPWLGWTKGSVSTICQVSITDKWISRNCCTGGGGESYEQHRTARRIGISAQVSSEGEVRREKRGISDIMTWWIS